jgi:hypothetical protein
VRRSTSEAGAKRKGRGPLGLCGIVVLVVLLGIVAATARLLWPVFFGKGMRGELKNAVAVPGPGGETRLWILTDGSFNYTQTTQSPRGRSSERKCKLCKTWLYVYDPVGKTVLARFRTDVKAVVNRTWLAYANGKIWVVTDLYKGEPQIQVYGTDPPRLVQETQDLLARHPELSSGVIALRPAKGPDRILMDTRDGATGLVLSLSDEKLYASQAEYDKTRAVAEDERVTTLILARPGSGPRRTLFKVTAPRSSVMNGALEFTLGANPSAVASRGVTATARRYYLEGRILHQDADGCLILHQDVAGDKANRLLTRVDSDGKDKWTTPPDQLFEELRLDTERDPFSSITFVEDRIDVSRLGDLVLLEYREVGVIGFDFETGRRLWEIRL